MKKLIDKKIVEVAPEEAHLFSTRVKMVGNEVVNLTLVEEAELITQELAEEENKRANKYKHDRKQAYASIEDQLDMLYWDMKNGTTAFLSHRDSVKAAYPKPI